MIVKVRSVTVLLPLYMTIESVSEHKIYKAYVYNFSFISSLVNPACDLYSLLNVDGLMNVCFHV